MGFPTNSSWIHHSAPLLPLYPVNSICLDDTNMIRKPDLLNYSEELANNRLTLRASILENISLLWRQGNIMKYFYFVSHMFHLKWLHIINPLCAGGPSYLGLTRSISWLLMPWLLTLPGHQQSWYWLYRICRSFSCLRKDFKYLCHINVEKWHKM